MLLWKRSKQPHNSPLISEGVPRHLFPDRIDGRPIAFKDHRPPLLGKEIEGMPKPELQKHRVDQASVGNTVELVPLRIIDSNT